MQRISAQLVEELVTKAKQSPRRRVNYNFHATMEAKLHRFLNVLVEGTYVQPHRHLDPPKDEGFVILQGEAGVVTFAEDGTVQAAQRIGARQIASTAENDAEGPLTPVDFGVDIPAGTWHTIVALSPVVVCYEVKPGPYSAADDKSFAAWAPREGEPEVQAYLAKLVSHFSSK